MNADTLPGWLFCDHAQFLRDGLPEEPQLTYGEFCFLCLESFDNMREKSDEHVLPRWILRRYDLYSQQSMAPNDESLRYQQRVVPCCKECNAWLNATLEEPMLAARNADTAPDPIVQQLWLAKIFYGSRFREGGLRQNLREPNSPTISDLGAVIEQLDVLRLALYAGPANIADTDFVGTFRTFQCGPVTTDAHKFDFSIPHATNICFIRFDNTILLGSFLDGQTVEYYLNSYFDEISDTELHPLQCLELVARAASISHVSQPQVSFFATEEFTPTSGGFNLEIEHFVEASQEVLEDTSTRAYHSYLQNLSRGLPEEAHEIATAAQDVPAGRMLSFTYDMNGDLIQPTCFNVLCPLIMRHASMYIESPCPSCGHSVTHTTP